MGIEKASGRLFKDDQAIFLLDKMLKVKVLKEIRLFYAVDTFFIPQNAVIYFKGKQEESGRLFKDDQAIFTVKYLSLQISVYFLSFASIISQNAVKPKLSDRSYKDDLAFLLLNKSENVETQRTSDYFLPCPSFSFVALLWLNNIFKE